MLDLSAVSLELSAKSILQDISFSLAKGEFIAVIGPNGAGKSSLLRLIQRALPVANGSIYLKQRNLHSYTDNALARILAVVSQNPSPLFALTLEHVAAMGLLPHKRWFERTSSSDKAIVANALQRVGLEAKAGQLIDSLSGGELQRLYIARALVQQPDVLLLDEPTNHLDVKYQHQIMQLVKGLGISCIACLHDLNLAAWYCDKVLLLHQGEQVAFGTPDDVLHADALSRVFGLTCEVTSNPKLNKLQVSFLPACV